MLCYTSVLDCLRFKSWTQNLLMLICIELAIQALIKKWTSTWYHLIAARGFDNF